MSKHIAIEENDNGEYFISIPQEILDKAGFTENTTFDFQEKDGVIIITEKTEWELEEALENFDLIVDRVCENKTPHIIHCQGKTVLVTDQNHEQSN